jgi:c-di-GMP-binding flagellar brake protein YcgR
MVDHTEKREFVRMNVETELTFTIAGSDMVHRGKSADLSATGVQIVAGIAPAVGDQISLVMTPSNERLPPFEAQGNVVRIAADEADENLFHISLHLTQTK